MGELSRSLTNAVNSATSAIGLNSSQPQPQSLSSLVPSNTDSLFGTSFASQPAPSVSPSSGGFNPLTPVDFSQQPSPTTAQLQQMPQVPAGLPSPDPNNPYTNLDPSDVMSSLANVGSPDQSQPAALTTPDESQATPTDPGSIDVSPAFKPHELHGLGRVADFFLSGLLSRHLEGENEKEAMQGFTQDPEQVIRRVATFNPKMALALQEKYVDNVRADRIAAAQEGRESTYAAHQNAATNALIDRSVLPQIGSLAMTIANEKNPVKQEAMWEKVRPRILAIGQQYGRDYSSMFPEKFDPDSISLAIGQAIKPQDQVKDAQKDRSLDQTDTRLGQTGKDTDSRVAARAARTSQGQQKLTMQQQAAANKNSVAPVQLPDGTAGVKKKVGNTWFLSFQKDGHQHVYVGTDGVHWQPYGTKPIKQ